MDHKNKIQSLVLHTDDPGDAPDCITEHCPCTCEYGHIYSTAPTAQKYGVSVEPKLDLAFLVRPEPSRSMPAAKYGQQLENRRKNLGGHTKSRKIKNVFLGKARNLSVCDKGGCQAARLFAHWCPFGHQRRAWPDGADPPHFHMHIGKIGQFLEVWVFRGTQVGLCVDGVGPARPLGTSRTPQGHQPCIFR